MDVEVPKIEQDNNDAIEYATEVAYGTLVASYNNTIAAGLDPSDHLPQLPFEQLTAEPSGQAFKDACKGIIDKLREIKKGQQQAS